jgi:peptidoglycan/LPS O-acetylase OafA/YrhL
MAVIANPMIDPMPFNERIWKRFLFPLGLAILLFSLAFRNPEFRETFRYSLQGIGLFAIFYCAVRFPHWLPTRWLNIRWVSFVGTLTFALYLVHATVLETLRQHFPETPEAIRAGFGLAISLAIAYAIFRLVEKPISRVRRSLESA